MNAWPAPLTLRALGAATLLVGAVRAVLLPVTQILISHTPHAVGAQLVTKVAIQRSGGTGGSGSRRSDGDGGSSERDLQRGQGRRVEQFGEKPKVRDAVKKCLQLILYNTTVRKISKIAYI